MDAAFQEFAAKGFAGTRLEDVAARAHVSKGLPYLYFKTKEELFKAVVKSIVTPAFDAMRNEVETTTVDRSASDGSVPRLHPKHRGPWRATIARLLNAEGPKHPELTAYYYEHILARGLATLQSPIDRGVERGELRATPCATSRCSSSHPYCGDPLARAVRAAPASRYRQAA